jgi:lysozyme
LKLKSTQLATIATYEGLSLSMYDLDGNGRNATIGFGHLIHSGAIDGRSDEADFKNGITLDQAVPYFADEISEHEDYVNIYIKQLGLDDQLTNAQFEAMVDLSYNKGPDDVKKILKDFKKNGTASAADRIRALNKNNKGLQLRRFFEAELFENGLERSQEESRKEKKKREKEEKTEKKKQQQTAQN